MNSKSRRLTYKSDYCTIFARQKRWYKNKTNCINGNIYFDQGSSSVSNITQVQR